MLQHAQLWQSGYSEYFGWKKKVLERLFQVKLNCRDFQTLG